MEVFICTLERILLLFMFILAGYLLVKFRALPKNSADVLAKLENNLFIPCLVLSTFAGNFTVAKISEAWKLFLLGMAVSIIMIVIAKLFTPLISKDRFTQNIYTYGLVFSNFGFMGNAIVCAVFPDVFLEYLIFTLPMWTLIYVWGVPFLLIPRAEGESVSIKMQLGKFINPMFVSMLIGMILGLAELDLPPIELDVKTGGVKQLKKEIDGTTKNVEGAAQAFSALGSAMDSIENPGAKVAGLVAQAIGSIVAGYGSATAQASEYGPWAWIAFAITGLATMISMVAGVKQATAGAYANGGIIPGNSFSGDNQIASVNAGELILSRSQQSNIASQLTGNNPMQNLQLSTEISGTNLRIVMNNDNRSKGGSRGYYANIH